MRTFNLRFKGMILMLAVVVCAGMAAEGTHAAQKADKQKDDAKTVRVATELLNIPLLWKPTVSISAFGAIDLTAFQNALVTVKPFNDLRMNPSEIGKNVEKKHSGMNLTVTTKDNVAAWLTDKFASILQEFEVPVVAEGGAISLEADIVKFYVTEESEYKANVGLKIRARSKTGTVIWEGMIAVSNTQWGSSYKAENYYKLLSNTCIDAVYALLKTDSFLQAVRMNK